MLLLVLLVPAGTASATSTPPIFGGPALIDNRGPFPGYPDTQLNGISCGSPTDCVAVGGKAVQFTSDAGNASPPHWSAPEIITQKTINGVSCPTSSLCVAVASDGTAFRSTDGGQSWSQPVTVAAGTGLPAVSCTAGGVCLTDDVNAGLYVSADGGQTWAPEGETPAPFGAFSCVPDRVCVAIGLAGNSVFVSRDVGGSSPPTWTQARIDTADGGPFLTDLSCSANDVCVAVDTFGAAFVSTDVGSASPSWSRALIDGTGSLEAGLVPLVSVTCAENAADTATDLCVAGDFLGSTAISTDVGAGPAAWTVLPTFDTGDVAATDGLGGMGALLYPVTCVSTGWCVASDALGDATYAVVPAGDPAGTVWSTPPVGINGVDQLSRVSCAQNGQLCAALDTTGHAVTSTDAGAHWSAPVAIAPYPGGLRFGADVSCVSDGACIAVENTTQVAADLHEVTSAEVLRSTPTAGGATWVSAGPVDLSGTYLGIPTGPAIDAVSCVDSGLCVALDSSGNTVISTDLGVSWTVVPSGDTNPLVSVSCATSTLCLAVDNAGRVVISTNAASGSASWSAPVAIDGPGSGPATVGLTAASCTTRGLCAAVDRRGRVVISTNAGATWSKPAAVNGSSGATLVGVSCTTSELCVAVDVAGEAFYTTNPASGSPSWALASSNTGDLAGISCVGTGLCVGVDVLGDATLGVSQVPRTSLSGATGRFPDTVLGTTSASQTLSVANNGAAPLNVASVSLAGVDAGQFVISANRCDGEFVPPGGSCSVVVSFAPTGTQAYSAADLVVASDAGSSPDQLAVTGTGVLGPFLSLSGGPVVFPQTAVGGLSGAQTVTATNTGGAPLHVSVAALTGADAGQFRIAAQSCGGAVLAPRASCDVAVRFAPRDAGAHSVSLELDSDAVAGQGEVEIGGTAVATAAASSAFSFVSLRAGKKGLVTAKLKFPRAGIFSVASSSTLPAAKAKRAPHARTKPTKAKRIAYARRTLARIKGPATVTIKMTPTQVALAALKRDRRLRVVVSVAFAPTGAARRTETSSVTVSGP
jgi:hypothetical protein